MKHAATDAVEAVQHSGVVEKAKEAAASAVDAVTHSAAYEAAQHAAHNVVEGARQVLSQQEGAPAEQPAAPAPQEPAKNEEAQVNQTGTVGFDEAEALTKPVTEEGQAGEHPKPDIHL